jgi:hypothetical protein
MKRYEVLRPAGVLLLAAMGLQPVSALHFDIVVGQSGGRLTRDFCAAGALSCGSLPVLAGLGVPANTLPTNGLTGRPICVTDYGDLNGKRFAVDDPGFFAGVARLPAGLLRVTARWAVWPTGRRRPARGRARRRPASGSGSLVGSIPRSRRTRATAMAYSSVSRARPNPWHRAARSSPAPASKDRLR